MVRSDPLQVNEVFRSYYADLYSSESTPEEGQYRRFLDGLQLPRLSGDDSVLLNAPFSLEELKEAVQAMRGAGLLGAMASLRRSI